MTDDEIAAMFTPGPPCALLLGWTLLAHDESRGWIKVGFEGKAEFLNPAGRIQGGMLAAMLDDTMGPAVLIKSGGTLYPSSIDMNISYLAAAKPGPLVCEGEVLRLGKTVGFVEGRLMDADGRVVAARHVERDARSRGTPRVARVTVVAHPSVEERKAHGKGARERTLPASHQGWEPAADRPDPIALLEAQNTTREQDLVPVRHGRMMVSPFTFYRGGAKIMAADLAATPVAGLPVQLCGDAHLSNFGVFGSPERNLLFDLNDFDETLPGPFEWDVKRLAASFTIAARDNGFTADQAFAGALRSASVYRQRMADFAQMTTMDIWYAHLSEADVMKAISAEKRALKGTDKAVEKAAGKVAEKTADKARTRDSMQALGKLAELVDGRYRIVSQPPTIIPVRDLAASYGYTAAEVERILHEQFRSYRATLQDDRRHLLERFELIDVARKVVGVGSVGTRAFIALLQGRDEHDPLFLQVKEASRSVLEDHLPKSRYRQPGERVVQGQRMMQAASDIYLGWTKGVEDNRYMYWRQLRDMKGSVAIETLTPTGLEFYADLCGYTLARAHARSGDAVAIAAYLGKKDRFEQAIADFSARYADQNERDYEAFCAAIRAGRLEAVEGL